MKISLPYARAFTLIELLIVIAIIALLTGIVTSSLVPAKSRSRDAKRISDVGQLQLALGLYFDRCKEYPETLTPGASNCSSSGVTLGTYISTIPKDPNGSDYTYAIKSSTSGPIDYVIGATLEKYNEVVRDGLESGVTEGSDSWIVVGSALTITCSNTTTSLNYCLGPK